MAYYNSPDKVTVEDGATLAVLVGGSTDWNPNGGTDNIHYLLANANFKTGSYLGIDTGDGDFSYAGDLGYGDAPNLPLGLAVLGGNTLTLAAPNTYSGGTNIFDGTLTIESGNSLLTNSALWIGANGTFDMNGNSPTIGTLSGDPGGNHQQRQPEFHAQRDLWRNLADHLLRRD